MKNTVVTGSQRPLSYMLLFGFSIQEIEKVAPWAAGDVDWNVPIVSLCGSQSRADRGGADSVMVRRHSPGLFD